VAGESEIILPEKGSGRGGGKPPSFWRVEGEIVLRESGKKAGSPVHCKRAKGKKKDASVANVETAWGRGIPEKGSTTYLLQRGRGGKGAGGGAREVIGRASSKSRGGGGEGKGNQRGRLNS